MLFPELNLQHANTIVIQLSFWCWCTWPNCDLCSEIFLFDTLIMFGWIRIFCCINPLMFHFSLIRMLIQSPFFYGFLSYFLYIDLIIIIIIRPELTSYLFICMNSVKFGLRDWRPWFISITCRTWSALLNRGML